MGANLSFHLAGQEPGCPCLCQEFVKAMKLDKLPDSTDCVKVEVQIMNRVQHRRKNLICNKKMPEVCPRICTAYLASTRAIDRPGIVLRFGVPDDDVTVAG